MALQELSKRHPEYKSDVNGLKKLLKKIWKTGYSTQKKIDERSLQAQKSIMN